MGIGPPALGPADRAGLRPAPPLLLIAGRIPRALFPRLPLLFALGGLQGALGWYMVASGLSERIDVSQYRLVAHLALGLALYVAMLWTALSLLRPQPLPPSADRLRRHPGVAALVVMTLTMGGFSPGLKAGFIYNSFPLMGGSCRPTMRWPCRRAGSISSRTPPSPSSSIAGSPRSPPRCGWGRAAALPPRPGAARPADRHGAAAGGARHRHLAAGRPDPARRRPPGRRRAAADPDRLGAARWIGVVAGGGAEPMPESGCRFR